MPTLRSTFGLTTDDVLIMQGHADFRRGEADISRRLGDHFIPTPWMSSPMDTVTELELAVPWIIHGGIPFIHRNLTTKDQAAMIRRIIKLVKDYLKGQPKAVRDVFGLRKGVIVGAAFDPSAGFEKRVELLVKAGANPLVADTAQGDSINPLTALRWCSREFPDHLFVSGNVTTRDGALRSEGAGAKFIRTGYGSGSICTARLSIGGGRGQLTAIMEVAEAVGGRCAVITDGGTRGPDDINKLITAGADFVMFGNLAARCREACGPLYEADHNERWYWGMGSEPAMERGKSVKSEEEYHGKRYGDGPIRPEGVPGTVRIAGSVAEHFDDWNYWLQGALYFAGAKNIDILHSIDGRLEQHTPHVVVEGRPHDINIR